MFTSTLLGGTLGTTESGFVLAEWRDAGTGNGERRLIVPVHVHRSDDEAWYVLEGTLGILLGEQNIDVPAGGAVMVPRGMRHTYWNAGSGPLRYILAMPPTIYRLVQAIHAATDRSPPALEALFREHDSEFLGWEV